MLAKLQAMCQDIAQEVNNDTAAIAQSAAAATVAEEDPCKGVLAGSCTRLFRAALIGELNC